jgi:polysaccharide biosynthesis protein PslH
VRDLLVTTHTPALGSGHSMRTYGIVRALAQHGELDLLYARFDAPEPDAAYTALANLTLHETIPSRGFKRLVQYGLSRLNGVPNWVARGASPELRAAATRLAEDPDRGRVIADGPAAAAALASLAKRRPVIYNSHNLESSFRHSLGDPDGEGVEQLREFERAVLARSQESWMVSQSDMEGARELCPQAKLRYVPNVVDAAAIEPVAGDPAQRRALFVGTFTYEPNRAGLRFLLDEVFPRVWQVLPDAQLTLVGTGLDGPPSDDPRVQALGFVESLQAVYETASCAVVPLLQGGGTPLKLVEALAYGLPVIATPLATAGLEVSAGQDCLIADGGEAFAATLVAVLREGAPELGKRGRELALERYSIEALGRLLAA